MSLFNSNGLYATSVVACLNADWFDYFANIAITFCFVVAGLLNTSAFLGMSALTIERYEINPKYSLRQ